MELKGTAETTLPDSDQQARTCICDCSKTFEGVTTIPAWQDRLSSAPNVRQRQIHFRVNKDQRQRARHAAEA